MWNSLFLYFYLLIIVLFSTWTTVNLLSSPSYIYHMHVYMYIHIHIWNKCQATSDGHSKKQTKQNKNPAVKKDVRWRQKSSCPHSMLWLYSSRGNHRNSFFCFSANNMHRKTYAYMHVNTNAHICLVYAHVMHEHIPICPVWSTS